MLLCPSLYSCASMSNSVGSAAERPCDANLSADWKGFVFVSLRYGDAMPADGDWVIHSRTEAKENLVFAPASACMLVSVWLKSSMSSVLCICSRAGVIVWCVGVAGRMVVQRAGFRRLWLSYRPVRDEVESFNIYLVEPNADYPMWLKFTGCFTTFDEPVPKPLRA